MDMRVCLFVYVSRMQDKEHDSNTTTVIIGVRARGLGAAAPRLGQNHSIFRAKAKFFGQKPAAKKMKKKTFFFVFNETKKRNSFCWAR